MQIKPGSNEFTRLWKEGPSHAKTLVQKYPIAALVSMVVLALLGLLQIFSFSITCIVSGACFGAASYGIGKTIATDCEDFWKRFKRSLGEILLSNELLAEPKEIEPAKPLNSH